MPRISHFYGITILMFFGDHGPPHFHARYGGYRARFTVAGELLEGDLPHRARRLVRQWAGLHAGELAACWARATRNEVPGTLIRSPERLCMVDITTVEVLRDRVVRLSFSDETERVVDLHPFLWGPAFGRIASDDDYFRLVRVDPEVGTIVWPNGADLDPDVLHGDHEPVWGTRSKSNS